MNEKKGFKRKWFVFMIILFFIGLLGNFIIMEFVFPSKNDVLRVLKKYTHFKNENDFFIKGIYKFTKSSPEYYRIDIELNEKEDYNSIIYKDFQAMNSLTAKMQYFHIKNCNTCLIRKSYVNSMIILEIIDSSNNKFTLVAPCNE